MPVHPAITAWLEALKQFPPIHTLPVEIVRQSMARQLALPPPPPAVGSVVDRAIPSGAGDIPIRVYTPFGTGPHPVTVYFHGGGFVLGNLETHDHVCRHLCLASGGVVVAVDYRLAPEHKFPAAPDDCLAALRWVAANAPQIGADRRKIAVAGDSAGANLATVTAIRIRDEGGPALAGQLLNCPVVDFDMSLPSYAENGEGYFVTFDAMEWFDRHYLTEKDRTHPFAAPMRTKELSGLPPAYVLTAEFDPLRDEGELYADRLAASGVPVVKKRYSNMIHAFPCLLLGVVPEAAEELAAFGAWLRMRFAAA
jgi:acetyl esterase